MNESQNPQSDQTGYLRTTQIVHLGLLIGLVMLTITITTVHFAIHQGKPILANVPKIGGTSLFFIIGAVLTGMGIAASATLPKGVLNASVKQSAKTPVDATGDETKLLGLFGQASIMRAAFLEGPGILCLIFFLVSGDYLLLALIGVLILLMLVFFPTQSMLERWLSEGHAALERERQNV